MHSLQSAMYITVRVSSNVPMLGVDVSSNCDFCRSFSKCIFNASTPYHDHDTALPKETHDKPRRLFDRVYIVSTKGDSRQI